MRIQVETDIFSKEVFDSETGQTMNLVQSSIKETKYYTIRKLNAKVCIMDIAQAQAEICKSSKDIQVFWEIVDKLDKYNEFRESATTIANKLGVQRSKVTDIISKSIKVNFLCRIDRGVYLANPFMIRSKGSTNEIIEKLQSEWSDHLQKETL